VKPAWTVLTVFVNLALACDVATRQHQYQGTDGEFSAPILPHISNSRFRSSVVNN